MNYFKLILLSVVILLFFHGLGKCQDAQYWGVNQGRDIEWNKSTRLTADSTEFFGSTATQLDTVGTDSVFYSELIITNGDGYEGIFHLTFSIDTLAQVTGEGAWDSITVHLRRYLEGHTFPWETTWHQIGAFHSTRTTYEYEIADSSWWQPANGFQIKMVFQDALFDSVAIPKIGPYIR